MDSCDPLASLLWSFEHIGKCFASKSLLVFERCPPQVPGNSSNLTICLCLSYLYSNCGHRMLFRLPDDLVGHVLGRWSELKDVCLLDSACCETKSRSTMLSVVSIGSFAFERAAKFQKNTPGLSNSVAWLMARSVTLPCIVVSPELEHSKSLRRNFLAKRGGTVRTLLYPISVDTQQCQILYQDVLLFCPSITAIELRHEAPQQMKLVLKKYGMQLRELHFGCALPGGVWSTLLETCHNLTAVHFRGPLQEAECRLLAQLILQSPQLERCCITKLWSEQSCLSSATMAVAETKLVTALVQGCPNLRILEVAPMYACGEALAALAAACPRLQKVDLFYSRTLSRAGGVEFVSRCHNLRDVKLAHRLTAPAPTARTDADTEPTTTVDATLSGVAQPVEPATLSEHVADSDTDLICVLAKANPLLEHLAVTIQVPQDYALPSTAGDMCLAALGRHCAHLTHLSFGTLTAHCPITDTGVEALAQGCRQLQSVVFVNCKRLTSAAVTSLVQSCSQLQALHMQGSPRLCDQALFAICRMATAPHHSRLRRLNLPCSFSVRAVLVLLRCCRALRHLSVGVPLQPTPAASGVAVRHYATTVYCTTDVQVGVTSVNNRRGLRTRDGNTTATATVAELKHELERVAKERGVHLEWCGARY
jgi:hypothetical protein